MSEIGDITAAKQPRLRNSLEQIREEMEKLGASELLRINLDPLAAVAIARGALPRLLPLRPQIQAVLPSFNFVYLDRLELYSLALMQANTVYCATKDPQKERKKLAAETFSLREQLLADINVLKARGFFPGVNLTDLKGPNGHLNIACDAMMLAGLIRDNWEKIAGRCAATLEELDRAEILCDELTRVVGFRNRPPEEFAAAVLQRRRAYTLFMRAYSEVRRAVSYVRAREGDANRLAPSFFCKTKKGRKSADHKAQTATKPESNTLMSSETLTGPVSAQSSPPVGQQEEVPRAKLGTSDPDPFLH